MNPKDSNNPNSAPLSHSEPITRQRRVDPILQEVYELKARLNKEAGYSVEKILERVKRSATPVQT